MAEYNGPLTQALETVRKLMCSEGGRQIVAKEIVEPFGYAMVPLDSSKSISPFSYNSGSPAWQDYLATNLLDALTLVPDTGDWHGALRSWCEQTMSGTLTPNRRGTDGI